MKNIINQFNKDDFSTFMSIPLHLYTTTSLVVEIIADSEPLSKATCFLLENQNKKYIITNKHVVTGQDIFTGEWKNEFKIQPDSIKIRFHSDNTFENWTDITFNLNDHKSGEYNWFTHPTLKFCDIAVIPLESNENVLLNAIELQLMYADMILFPSDRVSVIGFPHGENVSDKYPIWKTCYIATDLDLNYKKLPIFLIDGRPHEGMSGSPVLALANPYRNKANINVLSHNKLFLGIYSGRTNDGKSDLGMVWKASLINEILEHIE